MSCYPIESVASVYAGALFEVGGGRPAIARIDREDGWLVGRDAAGEVVAEVRSEHCVIWRRPRQPEHSTHKE